MNYVQLRERHLGAGEMMRIARLMLAVFQESAGSEDAGTGPRLLVNHRADVAAAVGAGVHLTSSPGELTAAEVRRVFAAVGSHPSPLISISCHSLEEVRRAAAEKVHLVLFSPVFEKRVQGNRVSSGVGLEMLRQATALAGQTRVLALGGVTDANADLCMQAGAAGIAGIRLFA